MSFKTNHITDRFKKTFVRARNTQEAEKVQKLMFSMGFRWMFTGKAVEDLGNCYIFVDENNRMLQSTGAVRHEPYAYFAERSIYQLESAAAVVKAIRKARKKDQRQRKALISAGWIKNTGDEPTCGVAEVRFNCGDTSASPLQWSWTVSDASYSISHYKPAVKPVTLEVMVDGIVSDAGGVETCTLDDMLSGVGATAPAEAGRTNPKDLLGDKKVPLWLCSPIAKAHWAICQYVGMAKYGAWNWRDAGIRSSVYLSAMQRHMDAYLSGEEVDPVDGTAHLGHIMACAAIMLDANAAGKLNDDRPPVVGIRGTYAAVEAQMVQAKANYGHMQPVHYTINGPK